MIFCHFGQHCLWIYSILWPNFLISENFGKIEITAGKHKEYRRLTHLPSTWGILLPVSCTLELFIRLINVLCKHAKHHNIITWRDVLQLDALLGVGPSLGQNYHKAINLYRSLNCEMISSLSVRSRPILRLAWSLSKSLLWGLNNSMRPTCARPYTWETHMHNSHRRPSFLLKQGNLRYPPAPPPKKIQLSGTGAYQDVPPPHTHTHTKLCITIW